MFFYICLVMIFVFPVVCFIAGAAIDNWRFDDSAVFAFFVGLIPTSFLFIVPVFASWAAHGSDISKVVAQHHRIEVYEERIDSLSSRLNEAQYPEKSLVSLDKDSPWATMMIQLSEAESDLASAKDERAKAIRSIEARKYGPMSGVVKFAGDYK